MLKSLLIRSKLPLGHRTRYQIARHAPQHFGYSTRGGGFKEDENDRVMREFFERMEQDRKAAATAVGGDISSAQTQENQALQDFFGKLVLEEPKPVEHDKFMDILLRYSSVIRSEGDVQFDSIGRHFGGSAAELLDLNQPVSEVTSIFADKILKAATNHELKDALTLLAGKFFSNSADPQIHSHASPKVLAGAIAKARMFDEERMIYALIQQIKASGNVAYVSWFNVHVFNELLFMDWEINKCLQRFHALFKEMVESGIQLNSLTGDLLKKVRTDVLLLEEDERLASVPHWNHIVRLSKEHGRFSADRALDLFVEST